MHRLLKRQIARYLKNRPLDTDLEELLHAVSLSYEDNDKERELIENALELNSRELEEANTKLRQQNAEVTERFLFAKRAAGIGVWEWDLQEQRIMWDDEMYALYGIHPNEFDGTFESFQKFVFLPDISDIDERIQYAIQTPEHIFTVQFRIRKRGEIRTLKGVGFVIVSHDNKPAKIIGVNWDITELVKTQMELKTLNTGLEKRVEEAVAQVAQKERMLLEQSRLATMGEMIGNIAHQWRQPLNAVGIIMQDLVDAFDYGECDKAYIDKSSNDAMRLIEYMSQTIEDFRNFFAPNREKNLFFPAEAIKQSLALIQASFESRGIIIVDKFSEFKGEILGYSNEYSQVILNILNNAKDVFTEREIKEPCVIISLHESESQTVLRLEDNGGGISQEIVFKIFDPYFTTKHQSQGTGLGLYMSKMIIEKNMGGTLSVENGEMGAVFKICV